VFASKVIFLCYHTKCYINTDKIIKANDGDTSSPNSLKDDALYNQIKNIKKADLTEENLLSSME